MWLLLRSCSSSVQKQITSYRKSVVLVLTCGWRQLGWSVGRCVGPWWDVDVVEVGCGRTRCPWSWTGSEADSWGWTWTQTLILVRWWPTSDGASEGEILAWETFSSKLVYQRDRRTETEDRWDCGTAGLDSMWLQKDSSEHLEDEFYKNISSSHIVTAHLLSSWNVPHLWFFHWFKFLFTDQVHPSWTNNRANHSEMSTRCWQLICRPLARHQPFKQKPLCKSVDAFGSSVTSCDIPLQLPREPGGSWANPKHTHTPSYTHTPLHTHTHTPLHTHTHTFIHTHTNWHPCQTLFSQSEKLGPPKGGEVVAERGSKLESCW